MTGFLGISLYEMASAKVTRLKLFEEIRLRYPNVAVKQSCEFKQAIFDTLEVLLSVKRATLSEESAKIFDKEVKTFYTTIPVYWITKRISRHKAALIKHHRKCLEYEISLDLPSDYTVNNFSILLP